MLYKWPKTLLQSMNKAITNYLWYGSVNGKKWVLVACNFCCLPVKQKGLGIKNLVLFNRALISWLSWKVLTVDNYVFDFLSFRFSGKMNRKFYLTSSIWPSICAIQKKLFDNNCWVIGKVTKLHFWVDNWIGSLLVKMLDLGNFVRNLDALVFDFLGSNEDWHLPNGFDTHFPLFLCRLRIFIVPKMGMISYFGSIRYLVRFLASLCIDIISHVVMQDWLYKV